MVNEEIPVSGREGALRRSYTYSANDENQTHFAGGLKMAADESDATPGGSWPHVLESWSAATSRADAVAWVWPLGNAVIDAHPEVGWQIIDPQRPELTLGQTSLDLVAVLERGASEAAAGKALVEHFLSNGRDGR